MKAEISTQINKDAYLHNLNECFPNWGDISYFDWVYTSVSECHEPSFLQLFENSEQPIAGTGITYRQLHKENNIIEIGVLTGSWTLPESRGKGAFTQIIQQSAKHIFSKGVDALCAYVVATNPSYKRLLAEGSSVIPLYYCNYLPELKGKPLSNQINILLPTIENISKVFSARDRALNNQTIYHYTIKDFTQQFFERSKKVKIVEFNNDFAIIENLEQSVRILFSTNLLANFLDLIVNEFNKKLFFLSTEQPQLQNCTITEGYFTYMVHPEKEIGIEFFKNLSIAYGDKM